MTYGNDLNVAARAAQSYLPNDPPPVVPPWQNYARPNSAFHTVNPPVYTQRRTGAPYVSQVPRRNGMRYLFSYGSQFKKWFRMLATGRVESTSFQPALSHQWNASFNDALYQAGYPRNLGFSAKVVNPNYEMQGTDRFRSQPRPRITNTIVTRRPYVTAPSKPAKPQNS